MMKKTLRNPVLWFGASQMSGEVIHLLTEPGEKKLDSLTDLWECIHN